ncbi:ricin-type beta-trefoil lectin domain protein [Actinoplanes subglobosus]|uniref:Ricin-type beta-trefoil lectin domain protein n=1 Tax=Actinoplanes subglobosus TaxID=1547892 RepID=A0ABV8IP29_9ACTN
MQKNGDEMRKSKIGALVLSVLAGALAMPSPASAASVQSFRSVGLGLGNYVYLTTAGLNQPVGLYPGSSTWMMTWTVENKGTVNGHSMVKLVDDENRCLDSNGSGVGGHPYVRACNAGDYQLWEVFHPADHSGWVVFKSRGAFTKQGGKHLCIHSGTSSVNDNVTLQTCNTNAAYQQWA